MRIEHGENLKRIVETLPPVSDEHLKKMALTREQFDNQSQDVKDVLTAFYSLDVDIREGLRNYLRTIDWDDPKSVAKLSQEPES